MPLLTYDYSSTENPQDKFFLSKKDAIFIFALALLVRLCFAFFSGLGPEHGADFTNRYDILSDNILNGEYNLNQEIFIISPLLPYLLAFFKFLFGSNWFIYFSGFQILLSSLSAVYLSSSAKIIFSNRSIALVAGVIYSIMLTCVYYVHLPGQESIFQSLFIISFYYISLYMVCRDTKSISLFALTFTLALLTKSHIILSLPFWIFIILRGNFSINKKILHLLISSLILILLTMPYGIYNQKVNGLYVISSSGGGGHFITSRNDDFYKLLVKTPPKDSEEYKRLLRQEFPAMDRDNFPPGLTHKELQRAYMLKGFKWIYANPLKEVQLITYNLINHLRPGTAFRYHSTQRNLLALLFNLPIYLFAYLQLARSTKQASKHLPAYTVFFTMILFSILYFSQTRFRVITVEPIYIIYAAPAITKYLRRTKLLSV